MNELEAKEKEILKDLIVKEEDTLQKLQELVNKSKYFFKIEGTSGKIIFAPQLKFTIPDKICLLLIGKYFANKAGIINSSGLKIKDLSNELGIIPTSLTFPLSNLIKENKINKEDVFYKISYHKIEEILDGLLMRYRTSEGV